MTTGAGSAVYIQMCERSAAQHLLVNRLNAALIRRQCEAFVVNIELASMKLNVRTPCTPHYSMLAAPACSPRQPDPCSHQQVTLNKPR